MRTQAGPWLADIAANVLAITVIVLIVLARISTTRPPAPPLETLPILSVAPLGGAAAVELLRLRLLPGTQGLVDVTADPQEPPGRVIAMLILDPTGYPAVVGRLAQRQTDWSELTVPDALKTPENRWDPEFLELASVAADPDRFRLALQDLLTRRAQTDRASSTAGLEGTGLSTSLGRWVSGFLNILGLLTLGLALWGLHRVRRWALTA